LTRVFLSAEWRYLAMLNYRVPPELLAAYVPAGTELDYWHGAAYISVVGFLFSDTRLLGVPVPFHRTFEEVNLRIYVRRVVAGEVRRAVTFLRELVPKRAIAVVARISYNEPYRSLPMRHTIDVAGAVESPKLVEYAWRASSAWTRLSVELTGSAAPLRTGSEEEFISQHYWGYTRQRDGSTIEYEVRHPAWRVWQLRRATLDGDVSSVFGERFANILTGQPHSAFLADGSAVTVHAPTRLRL
jgi:uncharacterized protein YqjF (DUF2071 family)